MLFAATRLTLVRELGVERFRETLFVTEAKELTSEGWERHEKHTRLEAPLTEEEREGKKLREAEAEESRGTGARSSHVSASAELPLKLQDGLVGELEGLKDGRAGRLVVLVSGYYRMRRIVLTQME